MAKKLSKKNSTLYIVFAIVVVVIALKLAIDFSRGHLQNSSNPRMKGNPHAPLKIVEFIDLQCPACANGSQYLKKVMEEHPDLIQLQLKYFPLAMHKHAYESAAYAQCAGRQNKFWPFVTLLLERQSQWQALEYVKSSFEAIATETQLNVEALNTCIHDESVIKAIDQDKAEGTSLGIKSTPTYYLNGKMVVGTKSLEEEINKSLGVQNK